MRKVLTVLSVAFTSMASAHIHEKKETSQNTHASTASFVSSYQQWVDPNNHFVDFFSSNNEEQARVIFIGSSAYSQDGQGNRPTVSEGMGYGLLLSYANDDQATFDKFLRYLLSTANNYGCSAYGNQTCYATAPLMMPWIVNEDGKPFWFLASQGATAYYSNGSATDADIQIAWALYLASLKVAKNSWQSSTFATTQGTLTYAEIFQLMGVEIRLNDVDMKNLRYVPGNQWGAAGVQVLYPGYFTPQAFASLDTLPVPDVSSTCPSFPAHDPINSLHLIFKNNIAKTVSIDYMGGNGGVQVNGNFVPKPGVPNGYTVSAITTAEAVFSSTNPYYANASIQATYYDEQGNPTMKSNYSMEYNNNQWTVKDNGSSTESSFCQSQPGNSVFVCLTDPNIQQVDYSFATVVNNSLAAIEDFQTKYSTGLMPNVIHYDGTNYDEWSESFAYDACRFPLWASDFIKNNPTHPSTTAITQALTGLLGDKGIASFIKNGTLPSGGIDAIKQTAVGNWDTLSPPLNAPVTAAAEVLNNEQVYNALISGVVSYDITKNQPSTTDPIGDSSPYFNAVMVLLTRACMENRFAVP